jgi:hypothetical protein
MSKRKCKKSKSDRFTEISIPIAHLGTLSDSGDEDLNVDVRRYVAVEGTRTSDPIELNGHEARKLAKALLKAAKRLDGGK